LTDSKQRHVRWICSCGKRFRTAEAAWKHPFNAAHVMIEEKAKQRYVQ